MWLQKGASNLFNFTQLHPVSTIQSMLDQVPNGPVGDNIVQKSTYGWQNASDGAN